MESFLIWLHETRLRNLGQLCRNAFQLPLTMICQFADYLNNLRPNALILVLKQWNERRDQARNGFAELNFILLVNCVTMLSNDRSP
jgi:hypothetical protein